MRDGTINIPTFEKVMVNMRLRVKVMSSSFMIGP